MPLSPASGRSETPGELIPADMFPPPVEPAPRASRPTVPGPTTPGAAGSGAAGSGAAGSGAGDASASDRSAGQPDTSRQLSLFGVESVDASPADVAGLLAGPGRLHRIGGTARVTVPVDSAWRVHALIAELAARGLEASWQPVGADITNADQAAGDQTAGDQTAQQRVVGQRVVGQRVVGQETRAAAREPSEQWDGEPGDDLVEQYPDDDPGGRVVGGPPPTTGEPPDEHPVEPPAEPPDEQSIEPPDEQSVEPPDEQSVEPPDERSVEPDEQSRAPGEQSGETVTGDGGGDADPGDCGEGHSGSGAGGVAVFEVRTAYSSLLVGLARTWLEGTAKRGPRRFFLTGPRLRLWAVAAGSPHPAGYELRWGVDDGPQVRAVVVAALAQAGLSGETVQVEGGLSAYRITGRRGLARLAELVGERPPAVPQDRWPRAWRA